MSIESDCLQAIQLIKEEEDRAHPNSYIIRESKALLGRTGASLDHVSHNANQCADHLARLGSQGGEDLKVMEEMPVSVREFLIRDKLNLTVILD